MSPSKHTVAVMTVVLVMVVVDRQKRTRSGRGGERGRHGARLFGEDVDGDKVRGHMFHWS